MNNYTLIDILSKEIMIGQPGGAKKYRFSGIQVPMIQRDYAHGRDSETEVRKRFLSAIFSALRNGNELPLDFVYGSVAELDEESYFVPLDGQQRLTTLFLLYWYIGNSEIQGEELEKLRLALSKFSYATRGTAKNFCQMLVKIALPKKSSPGSYIKKAGWFYSSFKKDPTVMSMLGMLDAIHEWYQQEDAALFDALAKITFYILPLDGFNLSDELYIKMNARGKQLTDFENFKADLINWMQDDENPQHAEFGKKVLLEKRDMPFHIAFALQMDNEWTNLFWRYTRGKINEKDKVIDPYFVRFWKRYLLNQYIIGNKSSIEAVEGSALFEKFYVEEAFKYDSFAPYGAILAQQGLLENIHKVLEGLSKNYDAIVDAIVPSWNPSEQWKLFEGTINQRQRLLFYAICVYLENNDFKLKSFQQWIRVIWNIIIDPDIRSIPVMISVMHAIEKISNGSNDIYNFLQSQECSDIITGERSFLKSQLEEERLKAKLILSDQIWEGVLMDAESHPLFSGNIGFLLHDNPNIMAFAHRTNVAAGLFSAKGPKKDFAVNHRLLRAAIGQLQQWDTLLNFNFIANPASWQLHLRRNPEVWMTICSYCDLTTIDEVLVKVKAHALAKSGIQVAQASNNFDKKAKRIHGFLYRNRDFFKWMQRTKATGLKYFADHLYIRRPRSWYDWAMVDTYRNQMATALIDKFGFITDYRCGDSDFYWGTAPQFTLRHSEIVIVAAFDQSGTLNIGIKDDGTIPENALPTAVQPQSGWIECKSYDYLSVRSDKAVDDFAEDVFTSILDTTNPQSMVYRFATVNGTN